MPTNSLAEVPLSALFGQLQALNSQGAATAESKIKNISQAYRPIDPAILNAALQEGGSLTSAAGTAGGDFYGMTPETFKAWTAQQVPLAKRIAEATSLSDSISGNSVTRKELQDIAAREQAGTQANIGTAAQMHQQNLGRAQTQNNFNTSEARAGSEFAANKSFQERQLAQQQGQFEATLDQRERELTTLKTGSAGLQAGIGNPYQNSAEADKKYDNMSRTTKPGEKMNRPAFEMYLDATAQYGAPPGTVVWVKDHLGGEESDQGTFGRNRNTYSTWDGMFLANTGGFYGFKGATKDPKTGIVDYSKAVWSPGPIRPLPVTYQAPTSGALMSAHGNVPDGQALKHAPKNTQPK